jgi:hypothetical protein
VKEITVGPKLPIVEVLSLSFNFPFENFTKLVRVFCPTAIGCVIYYAHLFSFQTGIYSGSNTPQIPGFANFIFLFLFPIFVIPTITSLHRIIIQHRVFTNPKTVFLFKKDELFYVYRITLITVLALIYLIIPAIVFFFFVSPYSIFRPLQKIEISSRYFTISFFIK